MMVPTSAGVPIDAAFIDNYLRSLIDRFFKILPLKENGETSLDTYMQSLQMELLGCQELVLLVKGDPYFVSLVSTLQYLIDNPDCSVRTVKREVFKAISICNKLKRIYGEKLSAEELIAKTGAETEVQDGHLG